MPGERGTYLGPRLRRLRRDLGLTQPGMAADLGISVSYISLLETNQRPLTADMVLKIARTYRIDIADFAGDGGAEFARRLRAALRNPLFADIDISPLQIADVATNYPGVVEAMLRLDTAHHVEQRALAERSEGGARPAREIGEIEEVRRFLAAHGNYFGNLDEAAEAIAAKIRAGGGMEAHLLAAHGLRVRPMPPDAMAGMIRRHDPHHGAVFLDESLDPRSRQFQLALQIAYLSLGGEIDRLLEAGGITGGNARRLGRRALANYAAAAILMPYPAFEAAAREGRYDIEALARRFATRFEHAAHRLTTLRRPGAEGIPFFFVRVDASGNVSKRFDGAGFPYARSGGSCPLWTVHRAFRSPGTIVTQWLELPDGQRFFSIARTVVAGGGAFDAERIERAVALVCPADHADALVYARRDAAGADCTPIGVTCSLCQRDRCAARAEPPIGRRLLPDDYHRSLAPFRFADD